ncbi:MAG: hypothetical protein ACE5NW_04080 [Acidiferrobacterales bacterium]
MIAPESRRLALFALGLATLCVVYLLAGPRWLPWDLRPGAPFAHVLGVIAGLLLLASLSYLPVRRSDTSNWAKPRAQLLHSIVGTIGTALAIVHSGASLREWSALVLLAIVALLVTGLYGRVISPLRVGNTFGRAAVPYAPVVRETHASTYLAELVETKRRLLLTLEPDAKEAEFVLRMHHWVRRPRLASRYHRLARAERRQLAGVAASGTHQIGLMERLWRGLHLVFAVLFVVGLLAHVITTVFFAGYVADGREIYWWHLTQW